MNTQVAPVVHDSTVTMSSLEIARLTDKNHADVMRDIRNIFKQAEIDVSKFAEIEKHANNRKRTVYQLPRAECDLVISGYSVKYRWAIIQRWYELEQQTQPLPNGLKRGRKTGSPEALTITPLELDALIDQRVKQVLEGEVELKADCPQYHYPLSDWQPQNRIGGTGWLTFRELFRVEPGQRPSARLIKQHQAAGDNVSGVAAEVDALYLLAESYYIKLDRIRSLLGDMDQRGLNIRLE